MARGVPGRTKKLLIYRQTPLTEAVAGKAPQTPATQGAEEEPQAPEDPAKLIEQMMQQQNLPQNQSGNAQQQSAPPAGVAAGLDGNGDRTQWVNIDGKWVQVGAR